MKARSRSMPRLGILLLPALLTCVAATASERSLRSVATWAYPQAASPDPGAPPPRHVHQRPDEIVRVSDSLRTYRYGDLFGADAGAVDWFPDTHPTLPPIVAHGTAPGTESCGGCHTVDGEGVPATAALAGLSREYMLEQIAAFRSGQRGLHQPATATLMAKEVRAVGDRDIEQAVEYFSHLVFHPHTRVVETASVPRTHWQYYVLQANTDGRREALGQRIIEVPANPVDYANLDPHAGFIAYVPPHSIRRGAILATVGKNSVPPCTGCHGDHLQGMGTAPPLAGRSPTYIARQLLLLATAQRSSANAAPMQREAARLTLKDVISVAAYAASLTATKP